MTNIGPHLLGRKIVKDARDWSLYQLVEHAAKLRADKLRATPGPLSGWEMTLRQIHDQTTYMESTSNWRSLLRWCKEHPLAPPVPAPPKPQGDTTPAWEDLIVLDQADTGHCVAFGWSGWGDAAPIEDTFDNTYAHALYYEIKKTIDKEPGEENGSTVRSGALAMRARGKLSAFAFAKSLAEIDLWLNTQGPIVVGTDWTRDMFEPGAAGYVQPTGALAGGHCYLMLDRIDEENAYLFQNSWGRNWSKNGRFKLLCADFETLLKADGEACCALEIK